jgi:hypothetical protein
VIALLFAPNLSVSGAHILQFAHSLKANIRDVSLRFCSRFDLFSDGDCVLRYSTGVSLLFYLVTYLLKALSYEPENLKENH